ncbi:MAG TPA: hypothetical protein VF818_11760 [Ktedonobacterales bacterium]
MDRTYELHLELHYAEELLTQAQIAANIATYLHLPPEVLEARQQRVAKVEEYTCRVRHDCEVDALAGVA